MTAIPARVIKITSCSLLGLLLSSCSGDNDDLGKYIHFIKARAPQSNLYIPELAAVPAFKFPENDTRRSPFRSVVQKKRDDHSVSSVHRVRQPLESFSVDTLKFVGTLKRESEFWALIKQPDMQITPVKIGDFIGQNQGCIRLITDNSITLEEVIKNSGGWEKKITFLKMEDKS